MGRPPGDVVEHLQGSRLVPDKLGKRGALRAAFIADKEVAEEHAQWWGPELEPHVAASRSAAADGGGDGYYDFGGG